MHQPGTNIRNLRKQLGLTLEKLALDAGLDPSNLSRLERGEGGYSQEGLLRLCKALGVSLGTLFADGPGIELALAGTRRIPVLDLAQIAQWRGADGNDLHSDTQAHVMTELNASRHSFALRIAGESMMPSFEAGDVVVIDPKVSPHPGDFVVAIEGKGEPIFRRFAWKSTSEGGDPIYDLIPLNSFYPVVHSGATSIRLLGTMVEHRKYRRPQ